METCITCAKYVALDGDKSGTCVIFGDIELIANDSTITDSSEEDMQPYHVEVGENFGCIHHKVKNW